jgi:D-alanyl-D-alanine carboxypeptidase (penicillin-binding protein 5/6)
MDTVRSGEFGLSNTNKLIRFYSGATGLKTGFTSGAGYCLSAAAQRDGMELIAVVMGCETSQDRFAACKSMLDYGFANFALVTPQMDQEATVPVKLGTSASVTAVPGEEAALLIDKAQKNAVTIQLTLDESVDAPVSKGQRIGTMTLQAGGQTIAQVPLVAQEAVPRLTFWQIFGKVLRRMTMAKE